MSEFADNPSFTAFLARAGDHKLLTKDEEASFAKRYEQGDQEARHALVEHNIRLVISIAKRYRGQGIPFEDLVQEGTIGLDKAIGKFNWRLGYKLSTYASWWIRQQIQRTISNHRATIRVPVHVSDRAYRYQRILERDPGTTVEEAAAEIECKPEHLRHIEDRARVVKSLDQPVGIGMNTLFGELLEDPNAIDPGSDTDDFRQLASALGDLDPDVREVLELRYGFFGEAPCSREEIAARLGMKSYQVRALDDAGMKTLREVSKAWRRSVRYNAS